MTETDETQIAKLYRRWCALRRTRERIEIEMRTANDRGEKSAIEFTDAAHDAQCEAVWSVEDEIAVAEPTSLDDVRMKAIVVKHGSEAGSNEQIVDALLDSLASLPERQEA
ncbi:hypothetical protein [Hyphomicrobium sp.]|uniref:hypothetical protein n=1 Tax=Hyphomicrobium sp. TaxID=82 RepID=UPI0025BAD705|nr:hypothetical protein [Hyphomicrobium sp.]MCC7251839.1 hypothetical protein [Hyphomicrobium sp.]